MCMELTKESTGEQLKAYFDAVLKLYRTGDQYPVDLNDVWMLVYPRKDHAVRELTQNFIQDVDYQVFLKNGENPKGGRPSNDYKLTVECMEYFIARKVREVFNVYRTVFKKIATGEVAVLPKDYATALRELADQVERNQQLVLENKQQAALIEEQKPKTVFADAIVGSKSSCLIGELAKIISQNGHKIGQNRLFVWLRQNHYLGTHGEYYNIPNQKYIEQGLFEIKKTTHSENGVMKTTSTPKVTGKGQQYFINLFLRQDRNLFGGAMV